MAVSSGTGRDDRDPGAVDIFALFEHRAVRVHQVARLHRPARQVGVVDVETVVHDSERHALAEIAAPVRFLDANPVQSPVSRLIVVRGPAVVAARVGDAEIIGLETECDRARRDRCGPGGITTTTASATSGEQAARQGNRTGHPVAPSLGNRETRHAGREL